MRVQSAAILDTSKLSQKELRNVEERGRWKYKRENLKKQKEGKV